MALVEAPTTVFVPDKDFALAKSGEFFLTYEVSFGKPITNEDLVIKMKDGRTICRVYNHAMTFIGDYDYIFVRTSSQMREISYLYSIAKALLDEENRESNLGSFAVVPNFDYKA